MKPNEAPFRESMRHHSVLPRVRDAARGIVWAYREEPNLRFHVFAASCVAVVGWGVRLDAWEVAYLAATVASVLFAELVNTAVERAVDLAVEGRRHPIAAQAKEVVAGAVLLAAAHGVFAAGLLFLVRRGAVETTMAVWRMVTESPWVFLLPLAAGAIGWMTGRSTRP